ncbi:PAS domain S-box protein [Candidatus Riflebacteria bacterium]
MEKINTQNNSNRRTNSWLNYIAIMGGVFSFFLGLVVLIGWYTHNLKLIQISEKFVPMQYNTALGFFLSGLCIISYVLGYYRASACLGGIVFLTGGLTLIEYIFTVDLGIDQLFMKHYVTTKSSHPGRMAPNTALCFLLSGYCGCIPLFFQKDNIRALTTGILGALIFSLGSVAFAGYVMQLETAYGWGHLTRMAIHTGAGFIIIGLSYVIYAWYLESSKESVLPPWVPIHVFIIGCLMSILLWQALHSQEVKLIARHGIKEASYYDDTVLVFGIMLTALLALATYLFQEARQRLRDAEFKTIFEQASVGVALVDSNTSELLRINKRYSEILGYSAEELEHVDWKDITHPDDLEEDCSLFAKFLNGTIDGYSMEKRYFKKDSEIVWVNMSLSPTWKKGEKPVKHIAIVEDITKRKQAEEQLLIQSTALTSTANCIMITDKNGKIQWTNPAFTKLTGYYLDEAMGKEPRILKSGKHPREFYAAIWKTVLSGNFWHGELINRKKDGTLYEEEMTITPVLNKTGDITHFVAIKQDISERKKAEEQLRLAKGEAEAASTAKSEFLANMSHEIRTPMNSVLGFLGLTLEDPVIPEKHLKNLKIANNSAKSLLSLINDILDVNKLESGKLDLEEKPFNLTQMVKETLQTLQIKTLEKGLLLEHSIHAELGGNFIGDPFRLRQIITNLVGNAIKFTEQGSITLNVVPADEEKMLHFTIADTGIGIPAERLDKIFESFTQADASTTRRFGGTGLGTTISSQLVELMHGKIWVESEAGKGSKFHFTVRMPATEKKDDTQADTMHRLLSGSTLPLRRRSFRILLADDIPENITLATIRLKQHGHTVITAANGLEAVEQFKKGHIDLILMDIQMPQMDGLEATKKIRELENNTGNHIPIIALTASVMKNELAKYVSGGMDATACKPIDFPDLFATIEKVVPEEVGKMITREAPVISTEPEIQPQVQPECPIPQLTGIDVRKGLASWQDPEVYVDALRSFIEKHKGVVQKITNLIGKGDLEGAYRVTHAMKGLTGNLAMTELYNIMEELDTAVIARKINRAKELLEPLADALDTVMCSMARLKDWKMEEEKPKKELDITLIKKLLSDILDAIEQSDTFAAEPVLNSLKEYLTDEQLKPIKESMTQFDFDAAKNEILILARSLDIELDV